MERHLQRAAGECKLASPKPDYRTSINLPKKGPLSPAGPPMITREGALHTGNQCPLFTSLFFDYRTAGIFFSSS